MAASMLQCPGPACSTLPHSLCRHAVNLIYRNDVCFTQTVLYAKSSEIQHGLQDAASIPQCLRPLLSSKVGRVMHQSCNGCVTVQAECNSRLYTQRGNWLQAGLTTALQDPSQVQKATLAAMPTAAAGVGGGTRQGQCAWLPCPVCTTWLRRMAGHCTPSGLCCCPCTTRYRPSTTMLRSWMLLSETLSPR